MNVSRMTWFTGDAIIGIELKVWIELKVKFLQLLRVLVAGKIVTLNTDSFWPNPIGGE